MATSKTLVLVAAVGAASLLAGCSSGGGNLFGFGDSSSALTTASIPEIAKVDPACAGLSTQISTLRQEGVADKIERAAAKKYKMTATDLVKADQLTKASGEYQTKCGTGPKPIMAQAPTTNIGSVAVQAAAPAATAAVKTTAAAAAPAVAKAAAAVQPQ
jgi:outer membrane murein-binding lipoprotein Lpp